MAKRKARHLSAAALRRERAKIWRAYKERTRDSARRARRLRDALERHTSAVFILESCDETNAGDIHSLSIDLDEAVKLLRWIAAAKKKARRA